MISASQIACWPIPRIAEGAYQTALIKAARKGILVPLWVPMELVAEYSDCACEHGEEHAASHVRKLKKELSL